MKILFRPNYEKSEIVRFEYFKNFIKEKISIDEEYKLLDIWCSQLWFWENSNMEVFWIDIQKNSVYDSDHFKIVNLDKEKLPYNDSFFDFIVAWEVIEHIKRPFEFIEECSRCLKKWWFLLLSTPNPHHYAEILKELFWMNVLDDKDHLNLFSRIHLTQYAKKFSLNLIEIKRYKFWIPFLKIMFISLKTPKLLNYQNIYIYF